MKKLLLILWLLPSVGFSQEIIQRTGVFESNRNLVYTATYNNGALPDWLTFYSTNQGDNNGSTDVLTYDFNKANFNHNGSYQIVVTASDGVSFSATDTLRATLNIRNAPPIVSNALPNQSFGAPGTFQVPTNTFFDLEGHNLTYSATLENGSSLPSWISFNGASRTFDFSSATEAENGTFTINLTVNDGFGGSVSDTFDFILNISGTPPTTNTPPVVLNPIPDQIFDLAETFQFAQNAFYDFENQALAYSATLTDDSPLPSWITFNSSTRTFDFTSANESNNGTISIRVIANDSNGGSVSDNFDFTLNILPPVTNSPPVLDNPTVNQVFTVAGTYQLPVNTFSDPDLDPLTYTATLTDNSVLPNWISFDANTQTFDFSSVTAANNGTLTIKVTANDGNGGTASDSFDLTLNIASINAPPVLDNPISDRTFTTPGTFQLPANTFSDPDGDPLSYSATLSDNSALPGWLTFDMGTRTFDFSSATSANNGTITIKVTVDDGNGGNASENFRLVLNISSTGTNTAPVLDNPIPSPTFTAPGTYQIFANTFSDPDGDPLTYSAALSDDTDLPGWITFDAGTRTFDFSSATAANNGTITIKVTVDDGNGGSASDIFDLVLNITAPGTNAPPTVDNPIANQTFTSAGTFQLPANTFSDPDGDVLTYAATLSDNAGLPSWVSFDTSTQTFDFSSATSANNGTITIKITVNDGNGGTASDNFNLTLNIVAPGTNAPPVLAIPIPSQTFTAAGTYQLQANTFTDPDGDPLTYSATLSDNSNLPGWITFDGNTQTFDFSSATEANNGTITIKVSVDDGNGGTFADNFDLTLNITAPGTNTPPVLNNPISNKTFTAAGTYQLPANTFSDPDGDPLAYTATLSDDSALPGWLTFNGGSRTFDFSSASETNNSTISIKVTVDDGNGGTTSSNFDFTLNILPPGANAPPVVDNPIPTQNFIAAGSFQVPGNTFSDPDSDPLTYTATLTDDSTLPSWITFDGATQTFDFSSATQPNNGTITIKVTVNDGNGGTVSDAFDLTLNIGGSDPGNKFIQHTEEEFDFYRKRAGITSGGSVMYVNRGDVQANNTGDWSDIWSQSKSFMNNPSPYRYDNYNTSRGLNQPMPGGDYVGDVVLRETTYLLSAAFSYQVIGGESASYDGKTGAQLAQTVRNELIWIADNPWLDYGNTVHFPRNGEERYNDGNPVFFMARWMDQMLTAYDYTKNSSAYSAADRANIEDWLYQGMEWFKAIFKIKTSIFPNYLSATNSYAGYSPAYSGKYTIPGVSGPWVDGGSKIYNNRSASIATWLVKSGIYFYNHSNSTYATAAKVARERGHRWFKELVAYGLYAGTYNGIHYEIFRSVSGKADQGLNYMGIIVSQALQAADVYERNMKGTPEFESLYDFEIGYQDAQYNKYYAPYLSDYWINGSGVVPKAGEVKSIKQLMMAFAQLHTGYYGNSIQAGGVNVTGDAKPYDFVIWLAQGNLYYRDSFIKQAYRRQNTLASQYYANPSGAGGAPSKIGGWGTHAGILFECAQMENLVWPY